MQCDILLCWSQSLALGPIMKLMDHSTHSLHSHPGSLSCLAYMLQELGRISDGSEALFKEAVLSKHLVLA